MSAPLCVYYIPSFLSNQGYWSTNSYRLYHSLFTVLWIISITIQTCCYVSDLKKTKKKALILTPLSLPTPFLYPASRTGNSTFPSGLVLESPQTQSLASSSSILSPFSSVQFSCSVMSDSLWPHELQHARPPCPSPTPRVYPNPCPMSQWCHPALSPLVISLSPWLPHHLYADNSKM